MKSFATLLAIFALALIGSCATPLNAAEKSVTAEPLGKIALGQKADDIVKLLGKPESKGEDALMAATGEWVQQWKFPALGLELGMASAKKGAGKTVSTITATGACKLATARGISIGSPVSAVRRAYGRLEEKQQSRPGKSFVAGSVYGGVIFTLKHGRVSEIFIGAAAE
jgi:hypothetical protein